MDSIKWLPIGIFCCPVQVIKTNIDQLDSFFCMWHNTYIYQSNKWYHKNDEIHVPYIHYMKSVHWLIKWLSTCWHTDCWLISLICSLCTYLKSIAWNGTAIKHFLDWVSTGFGDISPPANRGESSQSNAAISSFQGETSFNYYFSSLLFSFLRLIWVLTDVIIVKRTISELLRNL